MGSEGAFSGRLGGNRFYEALEDTVDDYLLDRVRTFVNESVDAWFEENKEAMQEAIRTRLEELCEQHVRTALYEKVSRVTSKFEAELKIEFGKQLRKEAEDVMKGHWNDIKARFIRAIHDGERIEAVPFCS